MPAIANDQQATRLFDGMIDATVENLTPDYSREVLDPLILAFENVANNSDGEPDLEGLLAQLPKLFKTIKTPKLEAGIEGALIQGAILGRAVALPGAVDLASIDTDDPFAPEPEHADPLAIALSLATLARGDFTPKPTEDMAQLFGKKAAISSNLFKTLGREQKARAFRIAGVNKGTLIQRAMDEIQKGLRSGVGRREIQRKILAIFADEGAAGIPNWHMTVLMRQNMMTTYNIARKRSSETPAVVRLFPYRQYLTVNDSGVRPQHAALHRQIFRKDDPFWDTHFPPWSWNCRCTVRDVSQQEVERKGGSAKVVIDNDFARTRLKVEGEEPGVANDPDFAFPRDQLGNLDLLALKRVGGELRQIIDEIFREAGE